MSMGAMMIVEVYMSHLPVLLSVIAVLLCCPLLLRALQSWATDLSVFDRSGKQLPGPGRREHLSKLPSKGWLNSMREGRREKRASQVISSNMSIYGDGRMMAFRVMGTNVIVVNNASMCKVILTGNHMIFPKSRRYNRLKFALGKNSLLLTNFDEWKHSRTMLNPFFHFEAMGGFVRSFNSNAMKLVRFLDSHASGSASTFVTASGGEALKLDARLINNLTLAIIMDTAFSYDYDFTTIADDKCTMSADIGIVIHELNRRVADDFDWSYHLRDQAATRGAVSRSSALLDGIISRRLGERSAGDKNPAVDAHSRDILDILIRSGTPHHVLRDQVLTFMAAGHETTATAMGWILYELSLNPSVQRELQGELDSALKGEVEVTLDGAAALVYTQQVIKEALRLHPPIPIIAKECLRDTDLGGYTITAGSVLAISILDLHRDREVFPEPERFDPGRFAKSSDGATLNPFAFVPFAAGPRNCIGQKFAMLELTVLVAQLLLHYDVSMDEEARRLAVGEETIVLALRGLILTMHKRRSL